MAYNRLNWEDRVTQHTRRISVTDNGDGTKTYNKVEGEVVQEGVPLSATNLNRSEEALMHLSVAFDMLLTIADAESRAKDDRIAVLEAQVASLASSS